ncbi:MAG: AAA family ATPase, partial [Alphaproteobacteria bacterium]|nr:AAA family ATPase [Alphaproteobacteria bacterium]
MLLFIGLQGSGKSTFYARRFLQSHLRLSRDLLRSANREDVLFHATLALKQRVVLDNTHLTPQTRRRRIDAAHAEGYRVVGVFFDTPVAVALAR